MVVIKEEGCGGFLFVYGQLFLLHADIGPANPRIVGNESVHV